MNGITYFRLKSPYSGDVTKNCALNGNEVDNNFYVLEGKDIESVTVEQDDLVLRRVNGEVLRAKDIRNSNVVSNVDFDPARGVLTITKNGKVEELRGFNTKANSGVAVAVDATLKGNGTPARPVGISVSMKTGQYRPVEYILDLRDGGVDLPKKEEITPGARILTKENDFDYGMLYDYEAVRKIACELAAHHSEWRIPTKEDWDDMLDAIEPCPSDKNHNVATNNRYLGKWAGKLLKSKDKWLKEEGCDEPVDGYDASGEDDEMAESTCFMFDEGEPQTMCMARPDHEIHPCKPTHCGHIGHHHHHDKFRHNEGLDEFGFNVTPAGYADDGEMYMYFGERAYFWTASNSHFTSAYAKRFEYDKSAVHQDIMAAQNHLSLRLIKDFRGDNFVEREHILGNDYSAVMMPSRKNGHAIWTSVNFACNDRALHALRPNNGQNLTVSTVYFINEWDGHRWNRKRMTEGETVVVKDAPRGHVNEEFMIKSGELVSVPHAIRKEVIEATHNELHRLHEHLEEKINKTNADLNEKIDTVQLELEGKIIDEENNRKASDDELGWHIGQTNEKLNALRGEYDTFVIETNTNFADVNEAIASEKTARMEADQVLSDRIDAELVRREEEDNTINTALEDAVSAINLRIDEVNANLISEAETRKASDDELGWHIGQTNEKLNALSDHVDALESQHNEEVADIRRVADNERINRENADADLRNRVDDAHNKMLVQEGSNFNTENGLLTLKSSKDGYNDIVIQIRANFGEF